MGKIFYQTRNSPGLRHALEIPIRLFDSLSTSTASEIVFDRLPSTLSLLHLFLTSAHLEHDAMKRDKTSRYRRADWVPKILCR